jgi:hypothetical protein
MQAEPRISKSPELCAKVLAQVMDGKSLRKIGQLKGMPKKSAFLEWVSQDDVLADQYARALKIRADHGFDEFLELANKTTSKNANAQRVKLDAHKWAYGKMNPKKYGEFQRMEVTGEDGGPLAVRSMTDGELDAEIARLTRQNGVAHPAPGEGAPPAGEQVVGVLPR